MTALKIAVSINSAWNFVNFRAGLLRALADDGHELLAIAPDDGDVERLAELGCRFVPIRMGRRQRSVGADLRLIADYHRILRKERPDVLLSFTIKPNIYGTLAARSLGIPTIANVAGLGMTFQQGGALNRLIRLMYRMALKPSRITFFQNPDDRKLFTDGGIVELARTELLPGSGVDLKRFVPLENRTNAPDTTFLLVARLLWSKGIAHYVEAARLIRDPDTRVRFRILGLAEEGEDAIDKHIVQSWDGSAIEYLGSASDVRPILAEADCVVLPTYYPEGTPRSLLEAAAMGKPIITTDVPGCRNVVIDGVNGFLCRPRDTQSLHDQMRKFLALEVQDRTNMGIASRQLAEERFDEQFVISAYRQALMELM